MTAIPVCLHCYEVFDPSMIKWNAEYILCPRLNCNHELVWIDENMIPIIFELNKKCYVTTDCCSGHIWNADGFDVSDRWQNLYNSLYIQFAVNVLPVSVPNGFTIEVEDCEDENNFRCSIRRSWNSEKPNEAPTYLEAQRYIFNNLNMLLEWAVSLPPIKGESFVIPEEEVELLNSEEAIKAFLLRRAEGEEKAS